MTEEGEVLVRRRRWPRMLAFIALLLGLALLGLWLARKPIARGQVDGLLAKAGVPARYTISDLGLGRQRLANVVIGDSAHPDLVADWLETRVAWGLNGPALASVRGGHVRVRARWADGRLSLGSIDRLLPQGEAGKPFALPALALDVADLRARVETPWGVIGAKLAGQGRLDGGFDGRLAVTSERLGGDCRATRPEGVWRVRTRGAGLTAPARVQLNGSTQVAGLTCGGGSAGFANANGSATLTLGDRLGWSVVQDIAATVLRHPQVSARSLSGRVLLTGGSPSPAAGIADFASGTVDLHAVDVVSGLAAARSVTVKGGIALDGAGFSLGEGSSADAAFQGVRLADALLRRTAAVGAAAPRTPLAPLLARFANAVRSAGEAFDATASGALVVNGDGGEVSIDETDLSATSGGRARWAGKAALLWGSDRTTVLDGRLTIGGGGLPSLGIQLSQRPVGGLRGTATVGPFAAGDARLALTPIAFSNVNGWHVTTRATLSGPLGDGRVEGLTLPIDATWRGGVLTLGPGCAPVGWDRVVISGLVLDPGGLSLCPDGSALMRVANGRVDGGGRIAAARLIGRLGSTPLTLAAAGGRVRLGARGFALTGVEARLGTPARLTRLSIGSLEGGFNAGGLAGRFAEAGGQIGNVPLVLSQAAGGWRFVGGALGVDGALTVSDAATSARFQPMAARGVTLRLAKGTITADGTLHEPATGTKVADVAIRHDLAAGTGTADLNVPTLSFVKGFQPDQLTRLTFGVIAEVRGTVDGEAHLAWTPAGVTSTGAFRTDGTDLAAAFGPVTGLAGEIRFTDLLALQSAPGQQVTVKSINPGVPVTDGVISFQTLPGTRVNVEGGRWPFAGGTLSLDPTLLDFSATAQRRMTFRVTGAAADRFLQSFDFKNLDATGIFDGVLPMVFDAGGGRIEDGRLIVRPGGGTIAYVGDISRENLGFWGNFAFDTLKSLRYRSLGIVMNGPLAGEMITEVRFAGISQGEGAKSNFIIRRLQRLPVVFNIRIRAPFRGLLDATASFYDPKRLIERNLPELIERERKPIQPPVSEKMP